MREKKRGKSITLRSAEFESTQIAWKATSLPLTYDRKKKSVKALYEKKNKRELSIPGLNYP